MLEPVHLSPAILPAWAGRLVRNAAVRPIEWEIEQASGRIEETELFSVMTARLSGAGDLEPALLTHRTTHLYQAIRRELNASATPHPVRIWNYLPDIHSPNDDGTDRYMTFNAGRFAAFAKWFAGEDELGRRLPSASAVGHHGQDFVVHVLACKSPGKAVANPRQIPPYRYSRRFGPTPPCFARATVLDEKSDSPMILIGGTASIRGEESMHIDSLHRQAEETFENLAALVATACGAEYLPQERAHWLARFRELRVYVVRPASLPGIGAMIAQAFRGVTRVEVVQADLCRSELLVEIEGVAEGVSSR